MGDKTRMHQLSLEPRAFVRPSPTRGILGGVAQHTNDIVMLCEHAGYDIVLVESVGLGQSEIIIDSTVDMLLLVVPPAGGDELQGSKKGIMEVADVVVVNKADGALLGTAKHSKVEYQRAIQLIRKKSSFWYPQVHMCSALEHSGIDAIWETMETYQRDMSENGEIFRKRKIQRSHWMWNQLQDELMSLVHQNPALNDLANELQNHLTTGDMSPRSAARELLGAFCQQLAKIPTDLDQSP